MTTPMTGGLGGSTPQIPDALGAPLIPGFLHSASLASGTTTTQPPNGDIRLSRFVVGRAAMLSALGLEVTVAGSAGAVVRLGLYALDWPSGNCTLLVDAGTIDGTAVGVNAVNFQLPVTRGQQLMLAAAVQGAPATLPTVRASTGHDPYVGISSAYATAASQAQILGWAGSAGSLGASVTGPLPAALALGTSVGAASSCSRVLVGASS